MIKAVIFDLDGTLLNTIEDLANACNFALTEMGLPTYTVEEYKHLVGDGRRNLILRMLPEQLRTDESAVERASGLFDTHYQAHMRDCTVPYPGIPQLLTALKAKGIRLGVVSNKPHEFVTQIVEHYFPGIFDSVAGQQGTLVKPDPAALNRVIADFGLHPDQVLYVGDSNVDIHTAQNAFYPAALTSTSQSLGAKRPRQAVRVFWICMGLTVGLGLVLCVLLRLFQTQLLGIYIKPTDDAYEAVMAAGVVRVLAISQFQWVGGMMETACGSIRGLGKTINPTVTTLIGACGLRIVWLYTIFKAVGTIESLYWSYPVSWVLTLAIHIVFLLIYKRQLEAPQKGENACAPSV